MEVYYIEDDIDEIQDMLDESVSDNFGFDETGADTMHATNDTDDVILVGSRSVQAEVPVIGVPRLEVDHGFLLEYSFFRDVCIKNKHFSNNRYKYLIFYNFLST